MEREKSSCSHEKGADVCSQRGREGYLVGDLPSVVFDGELWQWHLWPGIKWVVSMVIVALLKEGVVCCLATIRMINGSKVN